MLLELKNGLVLFRPSGRGPGRAKRGRRKDKPGGGQEQGYGNDADHAPAVQFEYGFVEFGFDENPDTLRAVQEAGKGAEITPETARIIGIVQPEASGDVQRHETDAPRHVAQESQRAPYESLALKQLHEAFRRNARCFRRGFARISRRFAGPALPARITAYCERGGVLKQTEQPPDRDPARECSPSNDREGNRHGYDEK